MNDWRTKAHEAVLATGTITAATAAMIKREVLADGKVSHEEAEFLIGLRRKARAIAPEFQQFFFSFVTRVVLPDAEITATETAWMKKILFADQRVDPAEKQFLKSLKEAALVTCPEFDELCHQHESV